MVGLVFVVLIVRILAVLGFLESHFNRTLEIVYDVIKK